MERRLQKIVLLLFLTIFFPVLAQEVSQERLVRFPLWASTEAYPGVDSPKEDGFTLPVRKIQEVSPFILSGMVYGWDFVYVPYDKIRGVQEYFELKPVRELTENEIDSINYAKPWTEDSLLNCWVEYKRTDAQVHVYKAWTSVLHPRVKGAGYAKLSDGFEGIKSACEDSLRNAVRNYQRKWIKTKPKEISGRVLVSQPPKIGVDAGRYKVTLDFFMETDKILEYKTF